MILIIALLSKFRFEDVSNYEQNNKCLEKNTNKNVLNSSVWLIGIAIVCYVYIEYIISYWFSPYLQESHGISIIETGRIIGTFWAAIAIFRLFAGMFILKKIKPQMYIMISAIIIIIAFIAFLLSSTVPSFLITAFILGIGCSEHYFQLYWAMVLINQIVTRQK